MVNRVDSNPSLVDGTIKNESHMKTKFQKIQIQTEEQTLGSDELSASKAQTITESMNQFLQSADSHLKFIFHEELSEYYVTIVDSTTDEVIREIPSKKLMDVHAAMKEFVGLLVDHKI